MAGEARTTYRFYGAEADSQAAWTLVCECLPITSIANPFDNALRGEKRWSNYDSLSSERVIPSSVSM
jgi:hypothetical protein